MICSRPQFLSLICILTASVAGCSSNDAPKPEPVQDNATVSQKIVFDGAQIGEGFYVLSSPTSPYFENEDESGTLTGNVCVSTDSLESTLIDSAEYRAFTAYDFESVKARLQRHLRNNTVFDAYRPRVEEHYEPFFSEGGEFVSVLGTIRATKQSLPGELRNFGDASACFGDNQPEDPRAFFETCGQRFLQEQERGIVLLLSVSTQNLSDNEQYLLDNILNVNLSTHGADLDSAMQQLIGALPNISFHITPLTISNTSLEPQNNLLASDGSLPPANWVEYRDQLRSHYMNLFVSDTVSDADFGEILRQHFADYSSSFFEECGQEMPPSLTCYYNFVSTVDDFYRGRVDLAREAAIMLWKIQNKERVRWTESPPPGHPDEEPSVAATIARYSNVGGLISECFSATSTSNLNACHDAFLDGVDICSDEEQIGENGRCQLPAVPDDGYWAPPGSRCDPDLLIRHIEALPAAIILSEAELNNPNPEQPSSTQIDQYSPQLGTNADGKLCVLNTVGGAFNGGGERAVLSYDPNLNEWLLTVDSQTQNSESTIIAGQECVPITLFHNKNFAGFERSSHESTANSNSYLESSKYAAAVSGFSGKMAGGGEVIQIKTNPNSTQSLRVQSQQAYLKGYANVFGVINPSNDSANYASNAMGNQVWSINTDDDGENEVILAPVESGICYLTEVRGKFDGGEERIALRPDGRNWVLRVRAGCEARDGAFKGGDCVRWKHVKASARCYSYNQY